MPQPQEGESTDEPLVNFAGSFTVDKANFEDALVLLDMNVTYSNTAVTTLTRGRYIIRYNFNSVGRFWQLQDSNALFIDNDASDPALGAMAM